MSNIDQTMPLNLMNEYKINDFKKYFRTCSFYFKLVRYMLILSHFTFSFFF